MHAFIYTLKLFVTIIYFTSQLKLLHIVLNHIIDKQQAAVIKAE